MSAAMRSIWVVAALSFAGCAPTVDWENVEGIERAPDEVFRLVDYPETTADDAFAALERVFRLRFTGRRLLFDREARTLETEPMPFSQSAKRVTVYGQVSANGAAARVELFAKIERLRDDLTSNLQEPWIYIGADAKLENALLEELWDILVVTKRVDGDTEAPAVGPSGR
jgi:hypothetical protein